MATRNQSDAIRQPLNGTWQQISGAFNFSYTSIAGFPRLLLHHDGSLYVLASAGAILWLKPEYQINGGAWTDSGWGPDGLKRTFPDGADGTISLQCNRPCFPTDYPAGTVINTRVMAKCSGSVVLCDSLLDPYPDVSKTWVQADSYQWNDAEDDVVIPLWGPIPDTGQTVQYAAGDDADYGWDVTENNDADGHAGLSYTDLGGGHVRDNRTGLVYKWTGTRGGTWDQDMAAAAAYSGLGRSWRLPTIKEMIYAQDYSTTGVKYDPLIQRIDAGGYNERSSTVVAGDPSLVWLCHPISGYTTDAWKLSTGHNLLYVSGDELVQDLVDNGDGTITDRSTGFMWTKYLLGGDGIVPPHAGTWAELIAMASAATVGGYSDWRLPNLKELTTIIDYTKAESIPAVDSNYFPQIPTDTVVWSSTTFSGDATKALVFYIMTWPGFMFYESKSEVYSAFAVRNA